jgi:mono/diheme cytochrome c family protein
MKRWGLWVCLAALWACDEGGVASEGPPPEADGPTWHQDVQALMTQHCTTCHAPGQGAPFDFTDPAIAASMAEASLDAIEAGRMPPWQADPDCNHFKDERIMPADDKAAFRAWVEAGTPMGTPGAVIQPQTLDLPNPDLVAKGIEPYVPDASRPDDYRCFPLDVTFDEDTFIRGTAIKPDANTLVHHVLVYRVDPGLVDDMEAMDAAEDGPGYTCYGGPGLGNPGPLAGWAPGAVPNIADEGSAFFMPAGGRLVMQIHYNVLTEDPAPDQTEVHLYTWDEAQPNVIETKPQADLRLMIPAGEPEVVNTRVWTHYGREPLEIVALAPHMHVLGTSIKVELERADGTKQCMIDIPDWDFNWQQTFKMRDGESIIVNRGDKIRLTCVYDNSAANQPTVNGEQLDPIDVRWGEGTLDEMCLNFISVRKPFQADRSFGTCRDNCDNANDFGCVADCLTQDTDGALCVLGEIFTAEGCGAPCLGFAAGARDCFETCLINGAGTEGALASCMADVCADKYDPLSTCMNDAFDSGACEGDIEACAL